MSAIDESSKREEEVMSFVASLESRLTERSDRLEDEHLEAAINAQIAEIDGNDGKCNNASSHSVMSKCYSPFVPSPAERIAAFFHFSGLTSIATTHQTDVLLDIGCGDGRVCIAAASLRSSLTCLKKVIGVDISPSCIAQACHVAYNEQNLTMDQCQFYDRDMTSDPLKLLEGIVLLP